MQQQLSFKLQELPSSGRSWSLEIPRVLFEDCAVGKVDAPTRLCRDVTWKGSVSPLGDMFLLQGTWRAELIRECVRCSVEFPWLVEGELSRHYRCGNVAVEDDECEYLAPPGLVELLDVLREEIWLAWKPMVVCSKTCKGLCQQCGENLNRDECKCLQDGGDHPFAALRQIKFDT